jgi:hypothetical protein
MNLDKACKILGTQKWGSATQEHSIAKTLYHLFNLSIQAEMEREKAFLKEEYYLNEAVEEALLTLHSIYKDGLSPKKFQDSVSRISGHCPSFSLINAEFLTHFCFGEYRGDLFSLLLDFCQASRGSIFAIEIAGDFGYVQINPSLETKPLYYAIVEGHEKIKKVSHNFYDKPGQALLHSIIEATGDELSKPLYLTPFIWRMIDWSD